MRLAAELTALAKGKSSENSAIPRLGAAKVENCSGDAEVDND